MNEKPAYIDLFAGCGGLSLGLHLAGWQGIIAIERNGMAFGTLKRNLIEKRLHFAWPNWLPVTNHDVDKVLRKHRPDLKSLRGKITLIAGGPPCGGFSMAGLRKEGDERNRLLHSYLKFVEIVRPQAILFENVRGFTMPFRANGEIGITFSRLIIESLQSLGYKDTRGCLIDMARFGVPQHRTRFILMGTRSDKAGSFFELLRKRRVQFLRRKGLQSRVSSRAALSDLEKDCGLVPSPDSDIFNSGVYGRCRSNFQRLMRQGIFDADKIDSHRFPRHTPAVEKVFRKLLRDAPRNRFIAGDERLRFGLKKRSVSVIDPLRPSLTVTTIPDDYVHYREPRVMTVRECARLQSFPDWFEFTGNYTTGGKERTSAVPRYTQVGNAIPPLFAEFAGEILKEVLTDG